MYIADCFISFILNRRPVTDGEEVILLSWIEDKNYNSLESWKLLLSFRNDSLHWFPQATGSIVWDDDNGDLVYFNFVNSANVKKKKRFGNTNDGLIKNAEEVKAVGNTWGAARKAKFK